MANVIPKIDPVSPVADVPVIFADGVVNLAPTNGTARFYLERLDSPADGGTGNYGKAIVAQVVMPMETFFRTAMFFNTVLEGMIRNGVLTQERYNEIKAEFEVRGGDAEEEQATA